MAASPKHVLTLVDHVGGLPVGNSEAILVILNWTAPSTIRNQVLQAQTTFVANVVVGQKAASEPACCRAFLTKPVIYGSWR